MIARGSSIVLRMALIYPNLLDNDKQRRDAIQVEHLEAALAVWAYCQASAELLFQTKTGSMLADKLLELLADGPMKKSEFTDHTPSTGPEIKDALAKLEGMGLVRMEIVKPEGAGRPSEQWEMVPK